MAQAEEQGELTSIVFHYMLVIYFVYDQRICGGDQGNSSLPWTAEPTSNKRSSNSSADSLPGTKEGRMTQHGDDMPQTASSFLLVSFFLHPSPSPAAGNLLTPYFRPHISSRERSLPSHLPPRTCRMPSFASTLSLTIRCLPRFASKCCQRCRECPKGPSPASPRSWMQRPKATPPWR